MIKTQRNLILILVILFIGIFWFGSCGWCHNQIKPSPKDIVFGPQADSATITTKNTNWWITGVEMNDSAYRLNISHDSLEGCCFTVAKRGKLLFVRLGENNTGKVRLMNVLLEAGDCFSEVHIKQLGQ